MNDKRRRFLATALGLGLVAGVGRSLLPRSAHAAETVTLIAKKVDGVPEEPQDALWQQAQPLQVALSPQMVVKPRLYEPGISSLTVRSLYDEERLGFLMEWADISAETGLGRTSSYRDSVAVQFPAEPKAGAPYFGMGEAGKPVVIYHWKADWQFGPDHDVNEQYPNMAWDAYPFAGKPPGQMVEGSDYSPKDGPWPGDRAFNTGWASGNPVSNPELKRRTPVEKLVALGFGSLTSEQTQDGLGRAVRQDGGWRLAMSIPRRQESFRFEPGSTLPCAFAAWEGAHGERGGEKAVSTWYFLALEQPVRTLAFLPPAVVLAGVVIAELITLRALRRRSRAA